MNDLEPWNDLTVERLLVLAGPASYKRGLGYHRNGNVATLEWVDDRTVRATVEGSSRYMTQLRARSGEFDAACTCPVGARGEFCKHAVAVALQLVDVSPDGEDAGDDGRVTRRTKVGTRAQPDPAAELRGVLETAPKEALVEAIMQRADRDPRWRDELLARVSGRSAAAAPDIASYKALLQGALQVRGYLDWQRTASWAVDAYGAIDALQDLVEPCPRDAVRLAEYALKRCEAAAGRIDDSGEVSMLVDRAQAVHMEACLRAGEAPVKLARRLYAIETTSELDVLTGVYTNYAEALGSDGCAAYCALAEVDWAELGPLRNSDDWDVRSRRSRVASVLEQVALADRDVDRIVEVVGDGFEHGYHYIRVVRACVTIGDLDAALHWCMAGIAAFPKESRLLHELAELHMLRGEPREALEPAWTIFERTCAPGDFDVLQRCAGAAGTWKTVRSRAFKTARARAAEHGGTVLVELHLHVDEIEPAWRVAGSLGCANHVVLRLAELRETTHPADSARVYLAQIDSALETGAKRRYDDAVHRLARADALLASEPERAEFDAAVAGLRERHGRKRTLMAKLDARGW